MLFTKEQLEEAINEGLVTKRKHPELDLWILNYTASAQFNWIWNDVTRNCRGLVVDSEGEIVARSFPKFFTSDQAELPSGKFKVYEKLDGSMLMAFWYKGNFVTCTRGSFESDQAIAARKFIEPSKVPEGRALIFEYIAPNNRIVVDYHGFEGVVLLGTVFPDGKEIDPEEESYGFPIARLFDYDLDKILSYEEDNFEGFVLKYESGERAKVKLAEYKRLHRIMTGVNEKHIWESIKDKTFTSLLEVIPDEMYDWVMSVYDRLTKEVAAILDVVDKDFRDLGDRKKNAQYYLTCKYPHLLFAKLDGKDVKELVWEMVKPKVENTYKYV